MARVVRRHPLAALLACGLLLRLAAGAATSVYGDDLTYFTDWARTLAGEPPWRFYAENPDADHLPGDLWLLWLVANVHEALGGGDPAGSGGFELLIELVAQLFDVLAGAVLFAIGRDLAGRRAGLIAAALWLLNPGAIFVSSVYGQWDSISACLALAAVWLAVRRRLDLALPALAATAVIKPQLAVLGALLVIFAVRGGVPWRRLLAGVALGTIVVLALTVPFDAAPPPVPTTYDLLERMQLALDRYPLTTIGAFNLWGIGAPGLVRDGGEHLLGLSFRTWGTLLLAAVLAFIALSLWRRPSERALLWACWAATIATFALPTRIHERYLLPAILVGAAVAGLDRRMRLPYALLSGAYALNVLHQYELSAELLPVPLLDSAAVRVALSALVVGVLVAVLAARRGHPSEGAAFRPAFARRLTPAAVERSALAAIGAASVVAAVLLARAGRGTTFLAGDWHFVLDRQGGGLASALEPRGDELVAVPALAHKALFATAGLDAGWALRAAAVALVVLGGVLLFAYARPRVGPWLAAAVAACPTLAGAAAPEVLATTSLGPLGSLAAVLAALLALDRRTRRADVAACVLLAAGAAASALGAVALGAVAVGLAGRQDRRRLWVPALPAAALGAWWLAEGRAGAGGPAGPRVSLDAAAGVLTGLGPRYGAVLAALLAAGVLIALVRAPARRARLAALSLLSLAAWALSPGEPLVLVAAILLGLLLAETLAALPRVRTATAAALLALLAVGVAENARDIGAATQPVRDRSVALRGALAVAERAGQGIDPGLQAAAGWSGLTSARYLQAVAYYGSAPAPRFDELGQAPPAVRRAADATLAALGLPAVAEGP